MNEPEDFGTILLVDTNLFFVKRLTEELRQQGFEVIHCSEPACALTMVEWSMPVAVLCATNLADSGSYPIPSIVHADAQTRHIAVVAIGDGGEKTLLETFRSGYDDFVDRRLGAKEIARHLFSFLLSRRNGFRPTQMLGHSETGLSGRLAAVDLPAVIQMLTQSRQTGALHINTAECDGVIFLEGAEIAHAESGQLTGNAAIAHLIQSCYSAGDGVYKFVPGSLTGERTVQGSVEAIILDALRILDEQQPDCKKEDQP